MDERALDCFRQAGRIASECREWARANIKAGVQVRWVLETIETMIRERGAAPGFPAQSSRNNDRGALLHLARATRMTYEEG